jgi:PadR family transcriptional regulator PadR
MTAESFENLRQELRRGSLVLAVLSALRTERYGYTLRKTLAENHLEIEESTLYPLLRRLEAQGLLQSQWREEDKRNKRFYQLSPEGTEILNQLLTEWRQIGASVLAILKEEEDGNL